jgi:hypothetical protein
MALKSASFYGAQAALKAKVPPGSSQAAFYTAMAEMMLAMLNDADVHGEPPFGAMVAGPNPVTGLGKIK